MNNITIRILLITKVLFLWNNIQLLANISENVTTKNVLLVKIHVERNRYAVVFQSS